jgi:chromosome segregation ATPase
MFRKQFREIKIQLNRLERMMRALLQQGAHILADLSTLTSAVEANADAEQSAILLIQELAAEIANVSSDQAAVDALAAQLQDQAAALAAAVVANTPVAPGGGGDTGA